VKLTLWTFQLLKVRLPCCLEMLDTNFTSQPLKMRLQCCLKTSGTHHPVLQHHMPEGCRPHGKPSLKYSDYMCTTSAVLIIYITLFTRIMLIIMSLNEILPCLTCLSLSTHKIINPLTLSVNHSNNELS